MQDVSPSIPLNFTVYFTCECYLRHTRTKMYACTHTYTHPCEMVHFQHLHSHQEVLTSQDIDGFRSLTCVYKFSLLRSSIAFSLGERVCMCVCASPLTVPVSLLRRSFQHTHSESSQARCYFNTHFRKMNEGRFSSSSHLTHSHPLFSPSLPLPSLQSEKPDPVLQ